MTLSILTIALWLVAARIVSSLPISTAQIALLSTIPDGMRSAWTISGYMTFFATFVAELSPFVTVLSHVPRLAALVAFLLRAELRKVPFFATRIADNILCVFPSRSFTLLTLALRPAQILFVFVVRLSRQLGVLVTQLRVLKLDKCLYFFVFVAVAHPVRHSSSRKLFFGRRSHV